MTEDAELEYEFEPTTYEKFMRKHLQHYGYYTGRNQGYRHQFKRYDDWEKVNDYRDLSDSTDSDTDGEDEDDKPDKLQDELLRTTQLVYSYEAGRMVPRLREPRNLYAIAKELGPQQAARWPSDLQVLGSRIRHIRYVPDTPEKLYQPTGQENTPMVRGEEYGGRLVYEYETKSSFFVRSTVGGTKNGYSICCVPLMSDQDRTLLFESRFECGNLAKVVQVGEHDYELWLRYDFYTQKHTQWFYFQVSNTRTDTPYRFTIVNFMKPDSLYNNGMKPLMYSRTQADQNNIGWQRSGSNIKYYRNNRSYATSKGEKPFYSLTWTVEFSHDHDVVYFAHCFPYSYSDLQDYLMELSNDPMKSRICKQRILCRTLAGNLVYILTITSPSQNPTDIKHKRAVVITSRVHPGESNSSWMMKGFLDYLTSNSADAKLLRDNFIFKIVPMLNPDGVIVGNYRCSLSGRDLNRNYKTVLKDSFPPVWHTRNMIKRLSEEREIVVYCDLHGHSRKQNVFIYGCENRYSSSRRLRERIFPMMLHKNAPEKFSFDSCKFKIQKNKEGTGRVVMWNMGIINSFTMEATFCGSTLGKKKGYHFSVVDYEMMGFHFCDTLLDYCDPDNTKCVNVFVELEERLKKEILVKLANQGMETEEIDLNEDFMLELESTDGGSDSSASDGLPIHLQYMTAQSEKKKKKLKSRKERNRQRILQEEKKTMTTASTQVPSDIKGTEKGQVLMLNGQKQNKNLLSRLNNCDVERTKSGMPLFIQDSSDVKPGHQNEYLEALTHTYVQNGVLITSESAVTPHLRYSGNKLPALAINMEGLCPHHEQAVAAQYMSHQLRTLQPPGTLALVGYSLHPLSSNHQNQTSKQSLIQRLSRKDASVSLKKRTFPRFGVESTIEDFIHTHIHSNPTDRLGPKRHLLEIAVAREREQFIQGLKRKEESSKAPSNVSPADNCSNSNNLDTTQGMPFEEMAGKSVEGSTSPIKSESSQNVNLVKGTASMDTPPDSDPTLTIDKKGKKDKNNRKKTEPTGSKKADSNGSSTTGTEKDKYSMNVENRPQSLNQDNRKRQTEKQSRKSSQAEVLRSGSKSFHSSPRPAVDMVSRTDLHVNYPDPSINIGITKTYKPPKTPFATRRAYTTETRRRQQQEMMKSAALETASDTTKWKPTSKEKLIESQARLDPDTSKIPASASQYLKRLIQETDEEINELTSELEEDVKRERKRVQNFHRADPIDNSRRSDSRTGSSTNSASRLSSNSPLDWAIGCVQVSHVRMSPLDTNWNSIEKTSADKTSATSNLSTEETFTANEQLSRLKSGKHVKRELLGAPPAKISLTISKDFKEVEQSRLSALRNVRPPSLRNLMKKP